MNNYWFIGIYLLIIGGIFGIARFFKTYKIDAKPLTQQTLFWLAIVIPIVSFIYFGLFAWSGKTPVFSAHGFERFIKISTLPLGLLSLAIPFTAVINNIHRTIQTNEQIEQSRMKNTFDLTFSHRKNATEYLEKKLRKEFNTSLYLLDQYGQITDKNHVVLIELENSYELYRNLFPIKENNPMAISTDKINLTIKLDMGFINKTILIWNDINDSYIEILKYSHPEKLTSTNPMLYYFHNEKLYGYIIELIQHLSLTIESKIPYIKVELDNGKI
ncbi:hypothetical protein GF683_09755, partial [Providencia alcalifaciens]|nr:hypothetical protein [Providencia alcalifaciens]